MEVLTQAARVTPPDFQERLTLAKHLMVILIDGGLLKRKKYWCARSTGCCRPWPGALRRHPDSPTRRKGARSRRRGGGGKRTPHDEDKHSSLSSESPEATPPPAVAAPSGGGIEVPPPSSYGQEPVQSEAEDGRAQEETADQRPPAPGPPPHRLPPRHWTCPQVRGLPG